MPQATRHLTRLWIFDWRKVLVYTHRWLGIAGCVLFVAWFLSGIVMMYARMPELAEEERLARAPALDLSSATVSPAEAAEQWQVRTDRVQIGMHGRRPVYRFGGGRSQTLVFADTATIVEETGRDEAATIAARYVPDSRAPLRYDQYLTEPDQWTLQAQGLLPMHRFAVDDDEKTHLYVSEVSGEVVLRTTRPERIWGYLGPVIHWVYFTPLRRNGQLWSEVIIWTSLAGCLMCASGLVWGVWRLSPAARFRLQGAPAHSPYAGWMKWHHYAGLIFGLVTLTWVYSGLLSMGPFNWFATPPMSPAQREASTGGPLQIASLTLESMRGAAAVLGKSFTVKELNALQFRGEPFWLAYRAPALDEARRWMHAGLLPRAALPRLEQLYVAAAHPERGSFAAFEPQAMVEIARAAMPGAAIQDSAWLEDYDGQYYDARRSLALPVLRVRYADDQGTWLYLDPARGGIVKRSVRVSRQERWLYHGLHSLDFPALYFRRPLWDVIAIALSIGGVVLSLTTVVPALRRFRRIGRAVRRRVWQ